MLVNTPKQNLSKVHPTLRDKHRQTSAANRAIRCAIEVPRRAQAVCKQKSLPPKAVQKTTHSVPALWQLFHSNVFPDHLSCVALVDLQSKETLRIFTIVYPVGDRDTVDPSFHDIALG